MTRYRTIVADPPWRVQTGPMVNGGQGWRQATNRSQPIAYPTMSVAEIAALPVDELAEDDAHLYLWTINRYVEDAYGIARAWGFRPSTLLTWTKVPMGSGLGGAFGLTTEHVLFCRRGTLATKAKVPSTWFAWKRVYGVPNGKSASGPKHSAKPEAFLDLVEQVSPGPYLELFARRNRLGWSTWGDEALQHVDLDAR